MRPSRLLAPVLILALAAVALRPLPARADGIETPAVPTTTPPAGQKPAPASGPTVEAVGFYYRTDMDARFIDMRTAREAEARGLLPSGDLEALAWQAWKQATLEKPLEHWRYRGGPSPLVFRPRVHVANPTGKAHLAVPVVVTCRAKVGTLGVLGDVLVTDYDYLEQSARWEPVYSQTVRVAALAPGEETLVNLPPIQLLPFLQSHPNRWPVQMEVIAEVAGSRKAALLTLLPDHFVLPPLE